MLTTKIQHFCKKKGIEANITKHINKIKTK